MRVSLWSVELRPLLAPPGTAAGGTVAPPVIGPNNVDVVHLHHRRLHSFTHSHSKSHLNVRSCDQIPSCSLQSRHSARRWVHTSKETIWTHDTFGNGLSPSPSTSASSARGSTHTTPNRYAASLTSFLAALRQHDVVRLYFCLLDLTRSAHHDDPAFIQVAQSIPPVTFSEILRAFDPFNIQQHVDSAPDIRISYGVSVYTPLGDLVNKWGVKVIYVKIFNRLRLLQRARRSGYGTPLRPLLNDYVVLMRCAAATADISAAKSIWYSLYKDGMLEWAHASLYAEFIKARYLTEALSSNNDLARLRLRPLDLGRTTHVNFSKPVVSKLKRLAISITSRQKHRFGQNVNEPYFAEPLTRSIRSRNPLKKMAARAFMQNWLPGDEDIICAFLKADGRMGRLVDARDMFKVCWDIDIVRDPATGKWQISGGANFPSGSIQVPGQATLDATVHCFGSQGEVGLAACLVDFLSTRYGLAVPNKVWSDLLDYARIMHTEPANTEWQIARWDSKILKPGAILEIWDMCTQEPYNFQPDVRDYDNLAQALIRDKSSKSKPLQALRQIKPLYRQTVQQVCDAWLELMLTTEQGVPNHAAYRRYRVLQSRKHHVWYSFHYAALQMLKRTTPGRVDDHDAVRTIPGIILELGSFLPQTIKYRIATGIVELQNDNRPMRSMQAMQALEPLRGLEREQDGEEDDEETLPGLEEYDELLNLRQASQKHMEEQELAAVQNGIAEHPTTSTDVDGAAVASGGKDAGNKQHESSSDTDGSAAGNLFQDFMGLFGASKPAPAEPGALDPASSTYQAADVPVRHIAADPPTPSLVRGIPTKQRGTQTITQLVSRPAHSWRPPFFPNHREVSLSELRGENKDFTGYHDDPQKKIFAAHRAYQQTMTAPGLPVQLDGEAAPEALLEHVLWMQR